MAIRYSSGQGWSSSRLEYIKFPWLIWEAAVDLSVGEFRLLGYLLRHQYGSSNDWVRLSDDELLNGRRSKRGRMDGGAGLSRNAVKRARRALQDRGYLEVERDLRDRARVRTTYRVVALALGLQPLSTADRAEVSTADRAEVSAADRSEVGTSASAPSGPDTRVSSAGPRSVERDPETVLEENNHDDEHDVISFETVFTNLFTERTGSKPTWRRRERGLAAELVAQHGLAECSRRAEVFFEDPPAWIARGGLDLQAFGLHFDKFAIRNRELGVGGQAPPSTGFRNGLVS